MQSMHKQHLTSQSVAQPAMYRYCTQYAFA